MGSPDRKITPEVHHVDTSIKLPPDIARGLRGETLEFVERVYQKCRASAPEIIANSPKKSS